VRDGVAHQVFGIVEQVLVGAGDRVEAVLVEKRGVALRADTGGGDLGLHVADDEVGDADIAAQDLPDRFHLAAVLVDAHRLELEPFCVGVDRVDDAAASRRQRADVEMVRRRHRKAGELLVVKDRNDETDVGAVRGAAIGVVVHEHVAGFHPVAALFQFAQNAGDVAGDRAGLERRAHRAFAKLAAGRVGQRGAEILAFADDARIAHAHELVAHLDGDVFKRPVDDRCEERINACLHLSIPLQAWLSRVMRTLPCRSAQ
jgi:hypothetical protein